MKKYLFFISFLIWCQCIMAAINDLLPTDKDTIVYDTIAWQPTYEFLGHTIDIPSYKEYPGEDSLLYIFDFRDETTCVEQQLHLLVLVPEKVNTEVSHTICYGESYNWNGVEYSETGVYVDTLESTTWADSIVTLHLIVLPQLIGETETKVIRQGESYIWQGVPYIATGIYTDTISGVSGCDSIVSLNLTVLQPVYGEELYDTICSGECYVWQGVSYSTAGTYIDTISGVSGCDSIVTLNLTVNNSDTTEFTATSCNSYAWNEEVYTTSGDYVQTLTNVYGCDSVVTLHLTVNYSDTTEFTATSCNSYTWNTEVYTTSGDYVQTLINVYGCDSVVTMHLTVNYSDTTEFTATTCNSYIWNNQEYIKTGDYVQTLTNVYGCDSVVTLHLTVNYSDTTEFTATTCNSYIWNNQEYIKTGDYVQTLTNVYGCDSVVTLHLTVNYSDTTEFTATTCNSYTWNEEVYTTSGDYVQTLTNVYGCDSVVTLHLTINYSDTVEIIEVVCDSFVWTNGVTYTESGTYYDSLTTVYGCDSIRILHLTVNSSFFKEETAVILEGDSYEWRGKGYSEEGVYFDSLFTVAGCDSVYSLVLEVEEKVILREINIAEQCAGTGIMDVELIVQSGIVDTIAFEFTQNVGFSNVVLDYEEVMQIPYTDVRAGVYSVKLTGLYRGLEVFEQQVDLTFLYPSTVMRKRWNDVVAVVTYDYNGGYNFVAFQWYRNGEMIPGATHSYINETLVVGTEYSVFLTEDNGTKLMSCPLLIDGAVGVDILEQVDIFLYPTLLIGGQNAKCKASEAATIYLYDMMGNLISEFNVEVGESELEMPYVAGAYMAKIITITNKTKNIKLIVQ